MHPRGAVGQGMLRGGVGEEDHPSVASSAVVGGAIWRDAAASGRAVASG